ncbi:MAG: hypothetical protein A2408_00895 [Candidatus Yonathbacteria bacterium RIFOXYC1_FULL_52_10]|uniref:Uncharacterized protein n=1 Tax=Candidatus Yonathbacteria bacterium RIFOXYD1_FULL_52_36 TaxID=1802730 RepID=A0A1G2SJR3_9BACT|nr:MAG: hypothetical protein A2591_03830 [Candidatus Yonathbacteria bacterium RIFOXYD1_FULL_52_36]OHA85701.1 MAG: hypothetical protein A2408_00895 [Candidatus Yonathbacteria bacterium RIFOXYC1_FULL_52_10]
MIRKITLFVFGIVFGIFGGLQIAQRMSNPVDEAVEYVSENGECLRVVFQDEELICSFLDEHRDIRVTVELGAPNDMIAEQKENERQQRFEEWRKTPEGVEAGQASF